MSDRPAARFHPEAPLNRDELDHLDRHRLGPVIESLSSQLQGWFEQLEQARRGLGDPPPAIIVGLLGGLGQGKSSVLHAVLGRLETRRVSRNLGCCLGGVRHALGLLLNQLRLPAKPPAKSAKVPATPWRRCLSSWRWLPRWLVAIPHSIWFEGVLARRQPRILRIDTSLSQAERIEHKLFSLLLFPHLVWGVLRASAVLVFLIWALLRLTGQCPAAYALIDGLPGNWLVVVLALLVPLAAPALAAAKELGQDWYGSYFDVFVLKAAKFLLVTPELLVIDDLDRARVEQQRAVLRALYKHARMLDCAVLVCFDEQELLAAGADPDTPEELLRKVVNCSVRIPYRTPEDALLLSTGICADWVGRNLGHPLTHAVASPTFAANVARVGWRLGQPGPRRIKELLAQTIMLATQRGVADEEGLTALLRIAALHQCLPEAAANSERLTLVLEDNRTPAFETLLTAVLGPAPSSQRQRALGLLQGTRMMQALSGGWRRLIGHDAPVEASAAPELSGEGWQPALYRVRRGRAGGVAPPEEARRFCLELGEELRRIRLGYLPLVSTLEAAQVTTLKQYAGPVGEAALGVFILAAVLEPQAEARLRVYRHWRNVLSVSTLPTEELAANRAACLAEWLADTDVWAAMTAAERRQLLMETGPAWLPERIAAFSLLLSPTREDFSLLLTFVLRYFVGRKDWHLAAALLRTCAPHLNEAEVRAMELDEEHSPTSLLSYIWPPVSTGEHLFDDLNQSLAAWGLIQQRLNQGLAPQGLAGCLSLHGNFEAWYWAKALRGLLCPAGHWRLDLWRTGWRGLAPEELMRWLQDEYARWLGAKKEDVLPVALALCLSEERWDVLDKVLRVSQAEERPPPTPHNGASTEQLMREAQKRYPSYLANDLEKEAALVRALPACDWFWFRPLTEKAVAVQDTLQAKLLAALPQTEEATAALSALRVEYRNRYEEIAERAYRNTHEGTGDEQTRFIQAMYEAYFRETPPDADGNVPADVI